MPAMMEERKDMDVIPLADFIAAVERSKAMPADDLAVLLGDRPARSDDAAYARYYRTAQRWALDTSAKGVSKNRAKYDRLRYMEEALETERADKKAIGEKLRECEAALAKLRALSVVRKLHPRA